MLRGSGDNPGQLTPQPRTAYADDFTNYFSDEEEEDTHRTAVAPAIQNEDEDGAPGKAAQAVVTAMQTWSAGSDPHHLNGAFDANFVARHLRNLTKIHTMVHPRDVVEAAIGEALLEMSAVAMETTAADKTRRTPKSFITYFNKVVASKLTQAEINRVKIDTERQTQTIKVESERQAAAKKLAALDGSITANAARREKATDAKAGHNLRGGGGIDAALATAAQNGADPQVLEFFVKPMLMNFQTISDRAAWAANMADVLKGKPVDALQWAAADIKRTYTSAFALVPADVLKGIESYLSLQRLLADDAQKIADLEGKWASARTDQALMERLTSEVREDDRRYSDGRRAEPTDDNLFRQWLRSGLRSERGPWDYAGGTATAFDMAKKHVATGFQPDALKMPWHESAEPKRFKR